MISVHFILLFDKSEYNLIIYNTCILVRLLTLLVISIANFIISICCSALSELSFSSILSFILEGRTSVMGYLVCFLSTGRLTSEYLMFMYVKWKGMLENWSLLHKLASSWKYLVCLWYTDVCLIRRYQVHSAGAWARANCYSQIGLEVPLCDPWGTILNLHSDEVLISFLSLGRGNTRLPGMWQTLSIICHQFTLAWQLGSCGFC